MLPLAWLAAGGLVGALAMKWLGAPVPAEPPRTRPLTFSGQDRDPAASPDGRLVAFASSRDGVSRIWIKQLQGGGEAPLTAGPDRAPRFSPDGSSVLFIRTDGADALGVPHRRSWAASRASWSRTRIRPTGCPTARRSPSCGCGRRSSAPRAAPRRMASAVGVRELASGRERILYSPEERAVSGLRVSPDGRTLGLIEGPFVLNTRFELVLIDVASGSVRKATEPGNPLGCLVWSGNGRLALARAGSPLGDGSGTPSRIFLLDPARRDERTLLFTSGLFPLAGDGFQERHLRRARARPARARPGRVADEPERARSHRLAGAATAHVGQQPRPPAGLRAGRKPHRLHLQPQRQHGSLDAGDGHGRLAPADGRSRTGLGSRASRRTGGTCCGARTAPATSRSGWRAPTAAGRARSRTTAIDAENPNATPDGRYVVYTSGNPQRLGVWRVRPDGTEEKHLVAGAALVPEISPDGQKVLLVTDGRDGQRLIRVADIETGALVPFQIEVTWPPSASSQILFGRARWTPDGRRIAFIGANAEGRSGVFVQDYTPGRDSAATRRAVAGFAPDTLTESLGVSPDGKSLVVSTLHEYSSLTLAEGLAGLEPPKR